jgi:hypothetical protein
MQFRIAALRGSPRGKPCLIASARQASRLGFRSALRAALRCSCGVIAGGAVRLGDGAGCGDCASAMQLPTTMNALAASTMDLDMGSGLPGNWSEQSERVVCGVVVATSKPINVAGASAASPNP